MTSIRALIIDDERYAREELIYLLKQFDQIKVIGEVEQGENAVIKVLEQEPDVVFLDVEMPKMNGIEVAKALTKLKHVPLIIFATAYPKFAAEAFRINAIDYLLKPYEIEQLTQAVDRVTQRLFPKEASANVQKIGKLPIEKEGEIDYIFVRDIIYIYPEGKISIITTGKQQYEVKSSLKELESRLEPFNFFGFTGIYCELKLCEAIDALV